MRTRALILAALVPALVSSSPSSAALVQAACTPIPAVNDRCPAWVSSTYDNTAGRNNVGGDTPIDMVMSPSGDRAFMTGESWDKDTGSAMGTGPGGYDAATVAFDPATGARLWAARYNGAEDYWDLPEAIEVSPDGSTVFVAGIQNHRIVDQRWLVGDAVILAYDAATGDLLWSTKYGPEAELRYSVAWDIVASPDGENVYVTGSTGAVGSDGIIRNNLATLALDTGSGAIAWSSIHTSPSGGFSSGNAMQVSPDGSRVYVTGTETAGTNRSSFLTLAYEAGDPQRLGETVWVAKHDGGNTNINDGMFLEVTPDGETVIVAGEENYRIEQLVALSYTAGSNYGVVAYGAATGERLWHRSYRAPGDWGRNRPRGLALSPDGERAFVTGMSAGSVNPPPTTYLHHEVATIALDTTSGSLAWEARHSGAAKTDSAAVSLRVSPDGQNVYVTGQARTSALAGGGRGVTTVSLGATNGTTRWVAQYPAPEEEAGSFVSTMSVTPDGSAVLLAVPLPGEVGTDNVNDFGVVRYPTS